ncbi:hypothetical protein [Saccharophagus degradans]|uniref:Uncharacterized protein n=1 Tax=Saccharophagus degradans TaxID=86304 RepID=A0AAW7X1Y0_9GAMM|nr:hypothetical protein [Saccharophagus degradans]MDO6421344.1 hypothetical protein [Saccharophagus degradans]MDO6605745.1 hypothetical protein [Saccharophagus degradans]
MDPLEINWPQSNNKVSNVTIEREVEGIIEAITEEDDIGLNDSNNNQVEVEGNRDIE